MATTKTSAVVEARRRAREAKAVLDAERAAHDAKVEEKTTEFYVAVATVEELEEQLVVARKAADVAVVELLGLGETADRVATLTGLSTKDVRRVRKGVDAGDGQGPESADAGAGSAT